MTIQKNEQTIATMEDWLRLAAPKDPAKQWVEGRSAQEVARAWLEKAPDRMPDEIHATLEAHPDFGPVLSWTAEPEAKLRFDAFRGEPRNADLSAIVTDKRGSYILSIEAKADEPFGETVKQTYADAQLRKVKSSESKGVARLDQLLRALFGASPQEREQFAEIRYQLLTATAGAICEAERQGCRRAVLLVHEFVTVKTTDQKHTSNFRDLNKFCEVLSGSKVGSIVDGKTYGPFVIPGHPLISGDISFYIGKATRNLRSNSWLKGD